MPSFKKTVKSKKIFKNKNKNKRISKKYLFGGAFNNNNKRTISSMHPHHEKHLNNYGIQSNKLFGEASGTNNSKVSSIYLAGGNCPNNTLRVLKYLKNKIKKKDNLIFGALRLRAESSDKRRIGIRFNTKHWSGKNLNPFVSYNIYSNYVDKLKNNKNEMETIKTGETIWGEHVLPVIFDKSNNEIYIYDVDSPIEYWGSIFKDYLLNLFITEKNANLNISIAFETENNYHRIQKFASFYNSLPLNNENNNGLYFPVDEDGVVCFDGLTQNDELGLLPQISASDSMIMASLEDLKQKIILFILSRYLK